MHCIWYCIDSASGRCMYNERCPTTRRCYTLGAPPTNAIKNLLLIYVTIYHIVTCCIGSFLIRFNFKIQVRWSPKWGHLISHWYWWHQAMGRVDEHGQSHKCMTSHGSVINIDSSFNMLPCTMCVFYIYFRVVCVVYISIEQYYLCLRLDCIQA